MFSSDKLTLLPTPSRPAARKVQFYSSPPSMLAIPGKLLPSALTTNKCHTIGRSVHTFDDSRHHPRVLMHGIVASRIPASGVRSAVRAHRTRPACSSVRSSAHGPRARRYRSAMRESDADCTVYAPHGLVCSVDHLASSAGVALLRAGGNAGRRRRNQRRAGGDNATHVWDGRRSVRAGPSRRTSPVALSAAGPAGSGADAAAMRAEGLTEMPMRGDVRSATVPGCVDGWLALHERFGRLPMARVLAPARDYAANGFPASPLLALATRRLALQVAGADDYLPAGGLHSGDRVRRPLVADALDAIARDGRDGFYGGAFGAGLLELGGGLFDGPISSGRSPVGTIRCGCRRGIGRSGPFRRRPRATWRWPAPGSPNNSMCPTTLTTRPGSTCFPRPPDGRATTGTRCCSTEPTASSCSPTTDWTRDGPASTRCAVPVRPYRRGPAARSICAWWTTMGWGSR